MWSVIEEDAYTTQQLLLLHLHTLVRAHTHTYTTRTFTHKLHVEIWFTKEPLFRGPQPIHLFCESLSRTNSFHRCA